MVHQIILPTTNNQQPTTNNQQPTTNNQQPTGSVVTPPSNPSQGSNPPATNGGTPPSNPSQGSNPDRQDPPPPPPSLQFGGTFIQLEDAENDIVYLTISNKNNLTHNNILLSGGKFDNVRNGKFVTWAHKALKSTSDKPDDIAFGDAFFTAFGQLTSLSDMPSGQATYKGNAFYIHEDAENSADIATGTAQFNVNFSNNSVDGNITVAGRSVKLPTATIDGNKFEGALNNLSVKGHFYGPQAGELGGIYDFDPPHGNGEKGFMGSFGATKQ